MNLASISLNYLNPPEGMPPCACGHAEDEHFFWSGSCLTEATDCKCDAYEPWTDQDRADAAYDAATEKWEERESR